MENINRNNTPLSIPKLTLSPASLPSYINNSTYTVTNLNTVSTFDTFLAFITNSDVPRTVLNYNLLFNSFIITTSNFKTNITINYYIFDSTNFSINTSINISIYSIINIHIYLIFKIFIATTLSPTSKSTTSPT